MVSPEERQDATRPRCPTCGRPGPQPGSPTRPFCSIRCKLIDLGRWLDEHYRVPGPALSRESANPEASPAESGGHD